MNPAVTNAVLMLGMMQVSKRVDFENPSILLAVRVAYVTSNLLVLAFYLYTRHLINKKKDLTTLKYVEPASPLAASEEPKLVVTTVMEYDLNQIATAIKGVFTGIAMMGFMHLYMKYTNPLLLQSIMPLKSALEQKVVQIYVFGKPASGDLKRPFKAASMFGQSGAEAKTDKESIEKLERSGSGGVKEE